MFPARLPIASVLILCFCILAVLAGCAADSKPLPQSELPTPAPGSTPLPTPASTPECTGTFLSEAISCYCLDGLYYNGATHQRQVGCRLATPREP